MNIYNKKEKKNNSNQLVIEKLTDLLKLSPDKLKKAEYSDFSGKYFNQIIDEVIESEKKPKKQIINQKNKSNYQQKNTHQEIDNNDNDNNDNNNNDINIINDNKNKVILIDMKNQIDENNNNNQNYILQYQSIDSSFSQNNKSNIKNNNNSPIISYSKFNDSSYPIKKIIFTIYYNTSFGQEIAISGSNDKLGKWDKNQLFYLQWRKGNKWVGELDIYELEDFEFKFVLCSNKDIISWEPGENNNVYFTALFNEIKDFPRGRYNKYEYEYNRDNGELKLNCNWPH